MKREAINGISEEFEQVLQQVTAGVEPPLPEETEINAESGRVKAWRCPAQEEEHCGEVPESGAGSGDIGFAEDGSGDTGFAEAGPEDAGFAAAEAADDGYIDEAPAEDAYTEPEAVKHTAPPVKHHGKRTRGREPQETGSGLLHPSDGLVAAFFVPVFIMIVIFAQRGIFPFGQESFLRTDMYHQYAPFFSEFQHKLTGGESLLYSWDIGLGVNFAALYAYYLASPLNWLLLLCPRAYIIEFMTYGVVLKIGLSGLAFAYYLKQHNRRTDFGVAFFGIFYALSGYMAAYSWNIMWLDCILLFPLIMLGLERLVERKKGTLYCVTLGLSILSNYYISIMICAFMVMYFICLQILKKHRSGKDFFISLLQFGVYSLLAGGLAAVVLVPEIYALQSTASGNVNFPKNFEAYFSIFDMLARHIGNVNTETGLDHWPNIYCGVAVYMFFLLYLGNKKIPLKEKAVYCGLLLLFFASFSVNVLNFMWHGFHYPNSLPCRQSFIYIFLMLALCYRAYMYLDETPKKHMAIAFWGAVCYVLLAQKLVTHEAYHFSVFYVAILFLAVYAGLFYLYRNPRRSRTTVGLLVLAVVSVEAAVNTTVTSIRTTSRTAYLADNENIMALTSDLSTENGFYRIEKNDRRTKNDGAWMNFPSVSLFSSMAHADLTSFFKKMGCEGSTNAYSITGSTPLVDSLLSVRYGLYNSVQVNPRLILNETAGDTYLYENPYTLPLGFMMPDSMETAWQIDMPNPIDVQNDLADVLLAPQLFTEETGTGEGTTFTFTPERDGEYYVNIRNKKVESVSVTRGDSTKTYDNMNRGYLLELGFCSVGESITIENKEDSEALNAGLWILEEDSLRSIYETLNAAPLILNKWEDGELEGVIEASEAGTVFLSVPYDKGWEVFVDGDPVSPRKVLDAFIGIDVTSGRHTITMHFMPEGLKAGALLSGVCAAVLLLLVLAGCLLEKKRANRPPSPYDQLDEEWHGISSEGEKR